MKKGSKLILCQFSCAFQQNPLASPRKAMTLEPWKWGNCLKTEEMKKKQKYAAMVPYL
jgi:hypothetical protein